MKLEDQIVSLELAKKLKLLNVKQESYFIWINYRRSQRKLNEDGSLWRNDEGYVEWETIDKFELTHTYGVSDSYEWYSAFTVAELGEMLPKGFRSGKSDNPKQGKFKTYAYRCFDSHCPWAGNHATATEDTEADARAGFLIYLLKHANKTV